LKKAQAALKSVENVFLPALEVINNLKVKLGKAESELTSLTPPSEKKDSGKRTSRGPTDKAANSTAEKRRREN